MSISRSTLVYAAAVLLLLVTSFGARVQAGNLVVTSDGLWFSDNDTVRRLMRMQRLADGAAYPDVDPRDGFPDGAELHWTKPMDWAIGMVDVVAAPFYPNAERFEAGALWVGVAVGTVTILLFVLLGSLLLGSRWVALAAAGIYAFTPAVIHATSYGNGDHQSLQHLFSLVTVIAFGVGVVDRGCWRVAILCGLALGIALWVSTESMVVSLALVVAAFVHLWVLQPSTRRAAAGFHLTWSCCAVAVVLFADSFEHAGGWPHFEWDRVSAFQAWPLLVFAAFVLILPAVARRSPETSSAPIVLGAILALLVGGALPMLVPAVRAAFTQQMASFAAANLWVQNTVLEYRPLLMITGNLDLRLLGDELGYLALGLPLWLFGWLRATTVPAAGRWSFAVATVVLFAFACKEVKLVHLFAFVYTPILAVGGGWWIARVTRNSQVPVVGAVVAVLALLLHTVPGATALKPLEAGMREVTTALRELRRKEDPADERCSVLAHWTHGAKLMYYGESPVIGSPYHRNLAGIHDSYRVLTAVGSNACKEILATRKVRFIVSGARPSVLTNVEKVLPELGTFAKMEYVSRDEGEQLRVELTPQIRRTLLWSMIFEENPDPRLRMVFASRETRVLSDWSGRERTVPLYRVWRVVYPDENR